MTSMDRKIKQQMKAKISAYDLYRIKGKLPPIQGRDNIELLKEIYLLDSTKYKYQTS